MNKNFKILGAVMLGFMSFSCNNNPVSYTHLTLPTSDLV